jgi:hypothetical protein
VSGGGEQSVESGQTQTILASPDLVAQGVYGNCMQAAIATILSKPLDAIPHFGAFAWWPGALRLWLRGEGLDYTVVKAPPIPQERAMLCGKSPRGHSHAVVSEGGRVVWDPHPSRDGLTEIAGAYVIHEWDANKTDPNVEHLLHAPHHDQPPLHPVDPPPPPYQPVGGSEAPPCVRGMPRITPPGEVQP